MVLLRPFSQCHSLDQYYQQATMPLTRHALKLQRTQHALGPYATAWLPTHLQLYILDLLLQDSTPAAPVSGLYVPQPQRPVQQLVQLQLVCKLWRAHVRYHPQTLRATRLHQLLRLVWLHDYVHFIIDGSSKSRKAKLIPAALNLVFPPACHDTWAPVSVSDQHGKQPSHVGTEQTSEEQLVCSQGSVAAIPAGHHLQPRQHSASSAADTSIHASQVLVPTQTSLPTTLQLQVLNRGVKRQKNSPEWLGLPATACIVSCSVVDLPAPLHTLKMLVSELELLDAHYYSSIILKLHCPDADSSKQATAGEVAAEGSGALHSAHAAAAAGSPSMSALGLQARLRLLASSLVSAVIAVECDVAQGVLWCIPTHSRINRRVAYNPADPISHLSLPAAA